MQHSTLIVVTEPAADLVDIATMRNHCRVDHAYDDALLAIYQAAARTRVESYLGRALITQTLRWVVAPFDARRPEGPFRLAGALELPRAPVASITSVTVTEEDGTATTLAGSDYTADLALRPARICIDSGAVLTSGNSAGGALLRNIAVVFVAGYSADGAGVPAPIKAAILLDTAFLYEHRGDEGGEMSPGVKSLLDPYRIWHLGA